MAQLVAHLHGMQGVRGSNPLRSTKEIARLGGLFYFYDLHASRCASNDPNISLPNTEMIGQDLNQRIVGFSIDGLFFEVNFKASIWHLGN